MQELLFFVFTRGFFKNVVFWGEMRSFQGVLRSKIVIFSRFWVKTCPFGSEKVDFRHFRSLQVTHLGHF